MTPESLDRAMARIGWPQYMAIAVILKEEKKAKNSATQSNPLPPALCPGFGFSHAGTRSFHVGAISAKTRRIAGCRPLLAT
jgi:hypothetical protein